MPNNKQRPVTAEDLYELQTLSGARISPDGEYVIYAQQRVDRKTEKKYSNLWLASTAQGDPNPRQFTFGDHADSKPRWSPDGKWIAFLSNRADTEKPARLYLIPSNGGEAYPLTEIHGEIDDFAWSPDGARIVFVFRKADPEVLAREQDEQKKKLGVVARHYDRVFYKLDGTGYLPKERWHLWLVDLPNKQGGQLTVRQLTDHPIYDEKSPAWSPDGERIVFLSNHTHDPDFNPDCIDLFLLSLPDQQTHKIDTPVGQKSLPNFSPDGKWVAYYGQEGVAVDYKNQGVWVAPAQSDRGAERVRNLTEPYDLHASSWTINDVGEPEEMPPTWSNDGQRLYFPVAYHGSATLMSISLGGEDLQTVIGEGGVVSGFSFDRNQDCLAYIYGRWTDPGQVFVRDMHSGESYPVTAVNHDLLKQLELGDLEQVWIEGPDGNQLQGWILKPPGFDPSRKYPSILEIHGGPLTQYGNFFMHEFFFLAAHDYVVHFSNPRGGRGYGEEHARAIWQDWGNADYRDVMAWTETIAGLPYIDPLRMGVTGGSYGGYMTAWIIGHTDRFKAAVTQRCVSNLLSMWGSSDFNWAFQEELGGKPPFEDLQNYWDHSPMKYMGNATTPTLVIHSENDLRCPIEQGEQVFVALKKIGVDSEMVRFPDEFHGLSRNGRTDRRIVRLQHILRWFDKYLKDGVQG